LRAQLALAAVAVAVVSVGLMTLVAASGDPAYVAAIEKFRLDRETRLKADDSWLTVAGLFWLHEGENTVGTDSTNDFVLPEGSAPPEVGSFEYREGKVVAHIKAGVAVTHKGQPVQSVALEPGAANALAIDALTMWVHPSGARLGIRLRDLNSPLRKSFTGCKWFPINEAFRTTGRFVKHQAPKTVLVPNILGDTETYSSPGNVELTLNGQAITMEALTSGQRLWFIFRDLTSRQETYPAARFLYGELAPDGSVVMDFNQAINPPCAFNPYTTCPLPPEQNRLRLRIEAGELRYHTES
jgi:uncharacterized protein (DUF1684 family)